ncbi:hypothetical protein BT63DRAFT_441282 [Microthyrium microscopicum]|uniref:Uncharacterized protein n=1 Tax=Microthyrium microscopicum TaxID=703497 RepID=A0A6A6U6W6_9PEZI|nr:hypothetical protein BT63DRAFT_441282 [Microthyrium microscopicum]
MSSDSEAPDAEAILKTIGRFPEYEKELHKSLTRAERQQARVEKLTLEIGILLARPRSTKKAQETVLDHGDDERTDDDDHGDDMEDDDEMEDDEISDVDEETIEFSPLSNYTRMAADCRRMMHLQLMLEV